MLTHTKLVAALALTAITLSAQAARLDLVPDSSTVTIGTPFSVNVVATLDAAEDLAAYFVDVVYAPEALELGTVEVTDALGILGVDAVDLSLPPEVSGGVGLANTAVESFLPDFSTQPDELVLARLTFTALALGETDLLFGDFPALDDPSLSPLAVETAGASISAVPLPASLWLLIAGVGALAGRRRLA